MGRHTGNSRQRIIDAAEEVVIERGAKNLTFDAVVSKSGISRGGILYHFPDKEALVRAMLDRLKDRTAERRTRKRIQLKESPEREILSHILSSKDAGKDMRRTRAAALFAAGTHDPKLLSPFRETYRQFLDEAARNGFSFERAAVIALAIDGLQLLELLTVSPFTARERKRIFDELVSLIRRT